MTSSLFNLQCVPTPSMPEIGSRRGKQGQAAQPVGITDETDTPIQDETNTTLVND